MSQSTLPIRLLRCAVVFAFLLVPARSAFAGGDWNDGKIRWRSYDEGLAEAKKEHKPICLIFYTEWCPHCQNYSGVFHDPKIEEMTQKFVMIRLDQDKNGEIGKKYQPDGGYIPRTFFLSPDGALDADLHAPRDPYRYFYDEKAAEGSSSVLAGMQRALAKYPPAAAAKKAAR